MGVGQLEFSKNAARCALRNNIDPPRLSVKRARSITVNQIR